MRCCVFVLFIIVLNTGTCRHNNTNHLKQHNSTTMKYYTKQDHISIPIMIHLDKELTIILSHETKRKIRSKFKLLATEILKDCEAIFARKSLHQKVKFQLLDVKIVKNNTKKMKMNANVSKYLKSYCQWQGEKKIAKKKWFYSIMFTGLDLYYLDQRGDEIRSSTGRGYAGGICSNKHSCTVLEWHPENIAFILTHEIAHSLGIPHDPPRQWHGQRYIMDPKYIAKKPAKTWNPNNRNQLTKFLKSKLAWCLEQDTTVNLPNNDENNTGTTQ